MLPPPPTGDRCIENHVRLVFGRYRTRISGYHDHIFRGCLQSLRVKRPRHDYLPISFNVIQSVISAFHAVSNYQLLFLLVVMVTKPTVEQVHVAALLT